ncbi:MAG TPA: AbrB/MazE/SpoVT family DNA-binding domain-containing protein [Candidatus Nanoarchaeia archaeon]|nr:AbrB/MazE/SpoVT family DNA-binding domain-containing protein [Candidatus Nanoarchaeia archaeon]
MRLLGMRTVTITSKGQIALPKEVRKLSGFKDGKKLAVFAMKDRIELLPMEEIEERWFAALMSEKSLAKTWLTKEENKRWKHL